ncbi:hypothetical protein H9P43_006339 [Blastocladiella emersonii ATCC 22665]|nr:hypothetical protein H9P43_006339 [Blastocladiella emersonii ATCC 22665]
MSPHVPVNHPTRRGAPLLNVSIAFKHHIRACVLVHGPFPTNQLVHDFFYSDYRAQFASDGSLFPFSKYMAYVVQITQRMRAHTLDVVGQLIANPLPDSPIPQFPDRESDDDVRGIPFNVAWMFVAADDGAAGAMDLHPFFAAVLRHNLTWRDGNCFETVSAYIERLNARAADNARGAVPKVLTLDHLAPPITSAAIATHLGVSWRKLPPISNLYGELVDALSKKQEPLGKRFVKQCRELVQTYLLRVNNRTARAAAAQGVEAKVVTLHQLAPVLVATIATLANVGIASHLGLDRYSLPPLQQLYNESVAALNSPNSILGKQFVEDSCALLDTLLGERLPVAKLLDCANDVSRDALSGLPAAVFAKREV